MKAVSVNVMRRAGVFAVMMVLSALVWWGFDKAQVYGTDTAPIRYVRTEGVFQHIDKEAIKKTLRPLVNTGFFSADIEAIRQAVLQMPWVESVSVKRVWPDAIDIEIQERTAYVRWSENSLLTERGEKFTPPDTKQFGYLPLLNGPAGQEQKVLEIMKGIRTALADQAMDLAEFSINDRRAWKLVLTNGMEILLGRVDQLKHFQRFLKTLTLFTQEQIQAMARADLRYPNGYAVSWRSDAAAIDWKAVQKLRQQSQQAQTKAL